MTVILKEGGALTKAPDGLLATLAEGPHLPMRRLTKHLATSRNTVNEWLRTFEKVAQVEVPTGPRKARLVNIYLLNVISEARHAAKQNGITWQEALTEQLRLTGFTPPQEPIEDLAALKNENAVLRQQVYDAEVHLQQAKAIIQSHIELLEDARKQIKDLNLTRATELEDQADSVTSTVEQAQLSPLTPAPVDPLASLGDQAAVWLRRFVRSVT